MSIKSLFGSYNQSNSDVTPLHSRTNLLDPRMRRWRPHSSHKDPMDPHTDTG